ncbi:MAG: hypothetical protein MUF22_03535 [Chitinispirillaceae bacterium]|jgi:hypothetical protein|nr:hypothetical protein [Chitinispirillaceae bacterium]
MKIFAALLIMSDVSHALCPADSLLSVSTDRAFVHSLDDTCQLRQKFLNRDTVGVAALIMAVKSSRSQRSQEALLWQARALVFSGCFAELAGLLDSVSIETSQPWARELLGYRLGLQRYAPQVHEIWSAIEYDCFIGKPENGVERCMAPEIPEKMRVLLLVRVLTALRERKADSAMEAVFTRFGDLADAPYLFLRAEQLCKSGQAAAGKELLLRIIREFPQVPSAEKARILLLKCR